MKHKSKLLKRRKKSFKISNNVLSSFRFALNGIFYCYKSSRNFKIHLIIAKLALILGFIFNLNLNEFMIIIATIMSVLILESLNTGIESLVDLQVEKRFNKLAKISKDCAAASVFLASINSIIVAVYIFFPKIQLFFINK